MSHFIHTFDATRATHRTLATLAMSLLAVCALPTRAAAQSATKVAADMPSTSAETRKQTDSLTLYFVRAPKAKPAALSVGGKTASQARKLDGKAEPTARVAPVSTPLPARARTTKP